MAPAPPAAIDLAFDVTEAATHAVFFFDGAISTSERLFKEGKGLGIGRTLSVDLELSIKASKCRGKFLGGFYLH